MDSCSFMDKLVIVVMNEFKVPGELTASNSHRTIPLKS